VLIILPAYNEEPAITDVIHGVRAACNGFKADILVVDGNSTDKTKQRAIEAGARVVAQPNHGKGEAVRVGLSQLDDHFAVVILDADGSYPPERIPDLVARIERGADIVVGSRLRGRIEDGAMSELNYLGNRLLSVLASALWRQQISDVCSGMWAFRAGRINQMRLNSQHFEIEAELFSLACRAQLRLEEVPIEYRRRVGLPKLRSIRSGLSIALKLVRKRFKP